MLDLHWPSHREVRCEDTKMRSELRMGVKLVVRFPLNLQNR